ncbi:MAG: hypothetical protein RJA61_372 [Candidatus Parcubacteria bacterium]
MHHKYHTDGLVLGSLPSQEANKFVFILTRDFGLVGAHAQGLRAGKSKLKYSLQDFSLSHLSFVHGKSGWKIVGAHSETSFFSECKNNPSKLYVCAHIVSFLRKLVRGEEKDEKLFNIVESGMNFLGSQNLSYEEIGTFECLLMLRILHQLGYIGVHEEFGDSIVSNVWNTKHIEVIQKNRKKSVEIINKALKESHL